jgi:hypothetical protein
MQLLVFLVPGLWGAWRGWQGLKLVFRPTFFLAAVAMLAPLMCGKGGWICSYGLLWPGWYLIATMSREPA